MLYSELEKRIIEELKQGYSYEKVAEIVNTTTHIVQKTVDKLKEYRAQNVLNEILMNKALRNQKILEKDYLDFFEEEIQDGKTSLELCYELEQQELQNGASVIFTEKRITDYLKELLYERTPYQYPEQYKELIAKLEENNQKNGYKKYCEFKNSGIDVTKYLLKQSIQAYENGDFKNFKDIFLLKCIITDYSKYLGLNSDEIIDEFNEYVFESTSKIPIDDIEKASKMKEDAKIMSPYTKQEKEKSKLPLILGIILAILIVAFAVVTIYNSTKDDKPSDNLKISYED